MTPEQIGVIILIAVLIIVVLCFLWPSIPRYRTIRIVIDADNMTAFTSVMAIINGALGIEYFETDQVVNMKIKVSLNSFKSIMEQLKNTPCVDAVEVKN